MERERISTTAAPGAIGPYSQAIRAGGFVFCSGQIALDPSSGEIVGGGIEEQTHQVLKNLSAVLSGACTSLEQAVKCTVFLADMNDFTAMNKIYGEYFGDPPPARATVEVRRLPRDVLVEIDVIAV
ncbi:MAG: RidA family protein [Planctomycetota bacterium]